MVVYTKKGDTGKSSTMNGSSSKSDAVYIVLGTLDELNASLGLVHQSKKPVLIKLVFQVQSDLFTLGSWLAGSPKALEISKYFEKRTATLEREIDEIDKHNKPIRNFIIPGGTLESSYLHVSRTLARRFERQLVLYLAKNKLKGQESLLSYANRLSDYLFVLARYYNQKGKKDLVWNLNIK